MLTDTYQLYQILHYLALNTIGQSGKTTFLNQNLIVNTISLQSLELYIYNYIYMQTEMFELFCYKLHV